MSDSILRKMFATKLAACKWEVRNLRLGYCNYKPSSCPFWL